MPSCMPWLYCAASILQLWLFAACRSRRSPATGQQTDLSMMSSFFLPSGWAAAAAVGGPVPRRGRGAALRPAEPALRATAKRPGLTGGEHVRKSFPQLNCVVRLKARPWDRRRRLDCSQHGTSSYPAGKDNSEAVCSSQHPSVLSGQRSGAAGVHVQHARSWLLPVPADCLLLCN